MPVKPPILISLFRRKGGAGLFTRLIDKTSFLFSQGIWSLLEDETPVILYFRNENDWFLVTDMRIVGKNKDKTSVLFHKDIAHAGFVNMREEYQYRIKTPSEHTRLLVKDKEGTSHIFALESGASFLGMLNVVAFAAGR